MAGKTKADLEAELVRLQHENKALASKHDALREKVQTRIHEAIENEKICGYGGQDALREFGLEPYEAAAEFDVDITISVRLSRVKLAKDGYGDADSSASDELSTALNHCNRDIEHVLRSGLVGKDYGDQYSVDVSELYVDYISVR